MLFETTLGTTLLVSAAARCQRQESQGFLLSSGTARICVASGKSAEAIMTEEFDELAGVESVKITRDGQSFSIDIDMSMFDRATRRRIYAKERELYSKFPRYLLNVHLNDRSQQGAQIDAVQG
jgi:hypothetical protein